MHCSTCQLCTACIWLALSSNVGTLQHITGVGAAYHSVGTEV